MWQKGKVVTSTLPENLGHPTTKSGSNSLMTEITKPHSLILFDSAPLLPQNFLREYLNWHSCWAAVLQPLITISRASDTIWVRGLVFLLLPFLRRELSCPEYFWNKTMSRDKKPQSVYLLQLLGTTWIVAPLRQVNNKISRPNNALRQDLLLFLCSNHFQFATEQEKVVISPTAANTQLSLMLRRAPVLAGKGAHVFCREQQQKFLGPAMWPQILASGGENGSRSPVASTQ